LLLFAPSFFLLLKYFLRSLYLVVFFATTFQRPCAFLHACYHVSQVTYKTRLDPKAELTIEEAVATVKDAFVTCGEV
jgi:hypothetical protein